MSDNSSDESTTTGTEADGSAGKNGPTDIPDETVSSESDLALDNLDARRKPGDKRGDQ